MRTFSILTLVLALPLAAFAEVVSTDQKEGSCLQLLILLHRHGDRSPIHRYPNDIHDGFEYLPEGRGNINKVGKDHAYELGMAIRRRYDAFLGKELLPGTAELRSTTVPRALESGALVIAAIYPPVEEKKWGHPLGQLWSPATFTTVPKKMDNLLQATEGCPALKLDDPVAAVYLQKELRKIKNLVNHVALHAGIAVNDTRNLQRVADTLVAQQSCGLKLPPWVEEVPPERLKGLIGLIMGANTYTRRQLRLGAGVFLNEIVTKSLAGTTQRVSPRLRLCQYSAHDSTLLPVLSALGVFNGLVPPFASAIIVEVHHCPDNDDPPGLKFLYQNETGPSANPLELQLPGCDMICPLPQFVRLYSDLIVTGEQQVQECGVTRQRARRHARRFQPKRLNSPNSSA